MGFLTDMDKGFSASKKGIKKEAGSLDKAFTSTKKNIFSTGKKKSKKKN